MSLPGFLSGVCDVLVVGGGIVGVATSRQLKLEYPDMRVVLLEKEKRLGGHQTGKNSGVIHAGVYYKPGSLMAKLCVKGSAMTYAYLRENGIRHRECGKVIVATSEGELDGLEQLYERAVANGVKGVRLVKEGELREIEPLCRGVKGIHCPHTGIVDYQEMTESIGDDFRRRGGEVLLGREVVGFEGEAVRTKEGRVGARHMIVCGGLQSDRLAVMGGVRGGARVIGVRGEYLELNPEKAKLIRGNIYPVPDRRFPFLGVHFTPRMDGTVWVGPNALLALSREGADRGSFDIRDIRDTFSHLGFYRMSVLHWRFGLNQLMKSMLPSLQLPFLRRYIPSLSSGDVRRIGGSGVRAIAVDRKGKVLEDFSFEVEGSALHVVNAPSPAATAGLAIAELVVERARREFGW